MAIDSISDNKSCEQLPHKVSIEYKELFYLGTVMCSYIEDLNKNIIVVEDKDKHDNTSLVFLGFQNAQKMLVALTGIKDRWSALAKEILGIPV